MELFQIFNASTLYFCCTLDVWNYNGFYYIAISAHWVDDELRRQSALLACKKCVENLACLENLYHLYSAAMTQYGIAPTQIVACTTLNMQNYFDDFGELNLGKDVFQNTCNPQLNDVAEKLTFLSNPDAFHVNAFMLDIIKLNKIWGGNFFRKLNSCGKSLHSSSMEKCCNIWRIYMSKEQTDVVMSFLGEPLVKPCLYSVTSLYAAIKQLLNSKEQLKDISKCLNVPCLSNQEIDYLQEFLLVYEPMAMAFEFLDMTQNHYYGCFLPTLVTIKWKLIRLYNSKKLCHLQDALQQLREDLQMDFKDYYNLDGSKSDSIMAALTYPPVKTRFLSGLKDNIYCLSFHPRNMLLKYGKEYHKRDDNFHNQYTSLVNISSAECEVTEFFDFGDSTDSAAENGNLPQSLKMEIDSYLADPDGSLKSLQKYPTVRRMFYRYNTCIPSPSSVSRIFPVTELLRTSLSSPWEEEQFENNFFYSHYYVNKNRM
ncbi:uncharacterized protein LOC131802871 [Musca domestica]|nr:uncharacterized protein LOC131802871 [Musca domestica]